MNLFQKNGINEKCLTIFLFWFSEAILYCIILTRTKYEEWDTQMSYPVMFALIFDNILWVDKLKRYTRWLHSFSVSYVLSIENWRNQSANAKQWVFWCAALYVGLCSGVMFVVYRALNCFINFSNISFAAPIPSIVGLLVWFSISSPLFCLLLHGIWRYYCCSCCSVFFLISPFFSSALSTFFRFLSFPFPSRPRSRKNLLKSPATLCLCVWYEM